MDEIYKQLSTFVKISDVKNAVNDAQAKGLHELKNGQSSFSVSITPEQLKDVIFPKYSKLIRVYGAKSGISGRVERHPNSFQTLYTTYGEGKTLAIGPNEGFAEAYYQHQYWSFVPENIWHQPVAIKDWVCVTFHSAPAEELIDEYKN
jgi:hypothetical protein